jgi:hypothetical protein
MMVKLAWSALILVALAAVAFWHSEGEPACNESRPVFGDRACCERHRVAGKTVTTTVADLEAARRMKLDLPAGP